MTKNVEEKSIIAIHVKRPRAKGFTDFTGGQMHYDDTPEGISNAKLHLSSLIGGNLSYKGHSFKLVRQKLRTTTATKTNPDGSTSRLETLSRTRPVDIKGSELNSKEVTTPIEAEAREHNDFTDKVSEFVNAQENNARNETHPVWKHLGFSGPSTMVSSRKVGESSDEFILRHNKTLQQKLGGIYRAATRWGTERPSSLAIDKRTGEPYAPGHPKHGTLVYGKYDPETKAAPKEKAPPKRKPRDPSTAKTDIERRMLERRNGTSAPKKRGRPVGTTKKAVETPKRRGRPATKPGATRTKQAKERRAPSQSAGQTPAQQQRSKLNARALQRGTIKPPTTF
jgi:hypothetical protein